MPYKAPVSGYKKMTVIVPVNAEETKVMIFQLRNIGRKKRVKKTRVRKT